MPVIVGFGNPLLDITIKIEEDKLLKKYNLKMDDQSQISEKQMQSLLEDIKDFPHTYTLGGGTLNTLRVFQWLNLNKKVSAYMVGAIGNDDEGESLKNLAENDGVITLLSVAQEKSTGVTVALVQNESRCLVAYIGAAETYSIENLEQIQNEIVTKADLFYLEGFFLTEREEVCMQIVELAKREKKLLMYNMSAPYISKYNPSLVKHLIENCDILIGNVNEFKAYMDIYQPDMTPLEFAMKLNKSYEQNVNFKYGKIILITNGPHKITCVYGNGEQVVLPTEKLPQEKIKDTTGAGDAFAAGFVMGLFMDFPTDKCIKYGNWAALQIIQQIGCKIPDYLPNFV